MTTTNKKVGKIITHPEQVYANAKWRIVTGEIKRLAGRPGRIQSLFKIIAEKIPIEAFASVKKQIRSDFGKVNGVYVAHDSMSYPLYIGRGDIFARLATRFKTHPNELHYFSFYVVEEKMHEREIETFLIHVCGSLLQFNQKKKRVTLDPGKISDYEVGLTYVVRQKKRGRTVKAKKPS